MCIFFNRFSFHLQDVESVLAVHREKLNNLQKLAAQVSDFVGPDASVQIVSDISELDNQLKEIVKSVESSKKSSTNNDSLQRVRKHTVAETQRLINNVTEELRQQSKPKDKTSNEEQLSILRSHILNIGLIENNLREQKESTKMSSDENSSIVDTLNLLQKLFRDTIGEYNKLSSRLVNSSDNRAIYKIWHDYLSHVKTFITSPIPSDYNVLKEHLQLCKIHQSLLLNQRNALMHKMSIDGDELGSADFKQKHDDILAKLLALQTEIESRLHTWEKYRKRQLNLLETIDDIEREKSLLQLQQIYLKSLPKTKSQIEEILGKVAETEKEVLAVKADQGNLLNFIEDVTSSSLRLELSSTAQRLANIRASLETWIGFLERIQELNRTYEFQVKSIQDNYQRQMNFLSSFKANSDLSNNAKQQLNVLREKQRSLNEIKVELENLNSLKDEIKDYVSTYDIKTMRQTIWILWQQFSDINYEYSLFLNQTEERLALQTEFYIRYENLMFWLTETEGRLMEISAQKQHKITGDEDPYVKHFANNILEDILLREYERKWIASVGHELLKNQDEGPEKIDVESKLLNLETKWNNMKGLYDKRSRKVNEIKTTYYNLEARIQEIRTWLFETEKELLKPFIFDEIDKPSFDKQLIEYEKIQRSVEENSSNVAEILNLSEMILSELRNYEMEMTVKNLELAINNIEYRWKKLCESLVQRKRALLQLKSNLEEMKIITNSNGVWMKDCNELCKRLSNENITTFSRPLAEENIEKLNGYLEKIAQETQTFAILEKLFNAVLTANIDINNIRHLTSETREILIIWKTIGTQISSVRSTLEKYLNELSVFEQQYERIILDLTQLDIEITRIKDLDDFDGDIEKLKQLKIDFDLVNAAIDSEEDRKIPLMENSSENQRKSIKSMSDEYLSLFRTVSQNYKDLISQSDIFSKTIVEEKDAAVQVNTLPQQASVSARDAYIYEIDTALNEFKQNIDNLEKNFKSVEGDDNLSKTASQVVGKDIAACESSAELLKYLNGLLINDYECDDDEARTKDIETLSERFKIYLNLWITKKESTSVKKMFKQHSESDWKSCPFCSQRNWQQIDNDLWRLEQWLHVAENESKNQSSPPSNIEELEDVIQDQREFLLNLDSHKGIISSLNVVGEHLAIHTSDTEKATNLRKRLKNDNIRWDKICQHAHVWQTKLQQALIGNKEFHKIINELGIWLEHTSKKIKNFEPVDLASERSVMEAKFNRFKELKCEIERCEPRVISLQENSAQLLKSSSNKDPSANETYLK
jgi:nesprin-1